jgi:RNA polymerase sigma-70 factor, ECF subfamily
LGLSENNTQAMLKIEQNELASGAVLLRLEGTIKGPWLEELRHVTDAACTRSRSVVIDLREVSFLSREGIEFLNDRQRQGVILARMTPFVGTQLRGGNFTMNAIGRAFPQNGGESSAPSLRAAKTHTDYRERRGLEEFATRYGDVALAESWRFLRNEEEALELAHDVLRRAHRRSKDRQLEGDLKLWLKKLTAAAALGRMRTASAEPDVHVRHFRDFVSEHAKQTSSNPALPQDGVASEFRPTPESLRLALQSLPLQLRAVVILRDMEKLPVAQISVALGVEEPRVRERLSEARLALTYRIFQSLASSPENSGVSTESVANR